MEQAFQIGDKVEVLTGVANCNNTGDKGTIIEIDNSDNTYRVYVKGNCECGNWMSPSMFKLIQQ